MSRTCKLSILVPVYQVERYLRTCVDSLLQQHDDLEIILVDDGSTDASGKICDGYAKQHDFIHVVHKENGGLISARLAGLAQAKGRYIAFADSDDWVDPDYYRPMLEAMEQDDTVDICIGRAVRNDPNGREVEHCEPMPDRKMTHTEAAREMALGKHFRWELWNKVYRATLFSDFAPDTSIACGEDLVQSWELFRRARDVLYLARDGAYHYRQTPGSMTHSPGVAAGYFRALDYVKHHMWLDDPDVDAQLRYKWALCASWHLREHIFRCVCTGAAPASESFRNVYQEMQRFKGEDERIQLKDAFCGSYEVCLQQHIEAFSRMKICLKRGGEAGKPFYIYGTGLVADYAARLLGEMGGWCTGYLVSPSEEKRDSFYGRPVLYATEDGMNQDIVVYLAMGRRGMQAVCERFRGCRAELISADLTKIF